MIGVPDPRAGELPKAYVVRRPNEDVTEEDIVKFIEERVAPHKALRGGVEFIDQIPRALTGKILRKQLKAGMAAELQNQKEDSRKAEEENVLKSKIPDVEIPDTISWPEFVFQHFEEYGDRDAIVSIADVERPDRKVEHIKGAVRVKRASIGFPHFRNSSTYTLMDLKLPLFIS